GTLTLSGASANTYSGITTVSAGVLNLNKSVSNAVNGDLVVSSGATLLLSTSNQVGSSGGQTVTLSGGTITRAGGVSETFGALSVSTASVINFGATSYGNAGNLSFNGTYTPSALLTINNFDFASAPIRAPSSSLFGPGSENMRSTASQILNLLQICHTLGAAQGRSYTVQTEKKG
ncbi:MAG: autotransporter-associated beta strand repeat-containing protein, partial [Chthoniobacterales bacterium]